MKLSKPLKVLIVLVVLALLIFGGCAILRKPSLRPYQRSFGFSTKGLKIKITDHYYEEAFQDPWSGYVARVSGKVEGSVFDPALMDEGLSSMIRNTLELNNQDMAAAKREPLFREKAGASYKARILVRESDTSPDRWKDRLFIIYSPSEELYYIFYESFVSN